MKWSPTASFALAAGGVLALAALVTRGSGQKAEDFLAATEKRFAAGALDRDQFLRELALAREQALHEGQLELGTRIQLERGRVLLELGSFESARSELAAVVEDGGSNREVELLRIELERQAGDAAAGLRLAQAWIGAHPDDGRAAALAGRLHRMLAGKQRQDALADCETELVPEATARASLCARELCSRPASDPRRVALARDLRAIFGTRLEAAAEKVLVRCDAAAEESARARESFGRSLELEYDTGALVELAELLDEAGLGQDGLDLLTAATHRPGFDANDHAARFLVHALVARERWRQATIVASAWLEKHSGTPEFLFDACRACYGALGSPEADAGRLYNLGMALYQVRTAELGSAPSFFMGEAFFHLGTREMLEQAYLHLPQFALSPGSEPVPGARGLALRQLAQCCRTLGKPDEERSALESAVELEPNVSGESWLRLAELQLAATRSGFRAPDLSFARGMALLPARTTELLPRWLEIGADELRAIGLDARGLQQDLAKGLNVRPSTGAAPFELYTLARAHLEAGRTYEAQTLLQSLEEAVPGFIPALDLRIDLLRGRPREFVEAFLQRVETTGYDERARSLHAEIAEGALSTADLRRLVHADPEGSGRLAVARSLAARGETRPALEFVLQIPPDRLGPGERLFAARLELELGDPLAACTRLEAQPDELVRTPGALETWIDACLRAERSAQLREQLPARLLALALDRTRLVALADRLLAGGEAPLARLALLRLDAGGKSFRGGDVLWRLAACALALRDEAALAAALERASAFDTRGETELLALLALPASAEIGTLRTGVQLVRAAGWNSGPLGKAALALLAAEPEALRTQLAAARVESPGDPLLAELEAALGKPRARTLAAFALALERPALGAYALSRFVPDPTQAALQDWVRARLHRRAGEREPEERVLRALLARDPKLDAAWLRLLELRSATSADGERDLDLRLERSAALGADALPPAERDFDRSRDLERKGALEEALAAARSASAAAPDSGPITRHLARLALRLDRPPLALAAARRLPAQFAAASGSASTGLYLEALARARAVTPPLLEAEAERAELEALAALVPDDPRVLLAQARNDLETSATDPAFGAERAAGRLENFRGRHATTSFERLAAGSTESWTQFLLALDPARARAFLEAELARDPGNLQAWMLLPRCSAAGGRDTDALSEVAFVQRLEPRAEGLLEFLRIRSRGDWSPEGIALISERIRRMDPSGTATTAQLATEMRAALNLGPRGVPKTLEYAQSLAPERLASAPQALRDEVAWMHAIARLSSGTPADLELARPLVARLTAQVREPARKPLIAALRGLARPAAATN